MIASVFWLKLKWTMNYVDYAKNRKNKYFPNPKLIVILMKSIIILTQKSYLPLRSFPLNLILKLIMTTNPRKFKEGKTKVRKPRNEEIPSKQ